jgi:hypothetical protein
MYKYKLILINVLLVNYIGYEDNGMSHVKKKCKIENETRVLKSNGQRSGPDILLRIKAERIAHFVNRL